MRYELTDYEWAAIRRVLPNPVNGAATALARMAAMADL